MGFLKKNPFSCFFEMSAFGVELMTVSNYTWINTDKCKYRKKVKKKKKVKKNKTKKQKQIIRMSIHKRTE